MSVHVLPPDAVDYRKLFHRQAMRARLSMLNAAKAQQEKERQRAEAEARARYHATKGRVVYFMPVGPDLTHRDIWKIATYSPTTAPPQPLPKTKNVHTLKRIQIEVCIKVGISRNDMLSPRRTAYVAFARQFAMWRCKRETRFSLPEIGRRFDGRDHTTVLHASRKFDALYAARDPRVLALLGEDEA